MASHSMTVSIVMYRKDSEGCGFGLVQGTSS